MKFLLFFLFSLSLYASSYESLTKNILKDLHYIYQNKTYYGATIFVKASYFTYEFKQLSIYEIQIKRNIDGQDLDKPFIIDLRKEYSIELEANDKCNPALIISTDKDIVYLYVKDRCGAFGGFNLYKRAERTMFLLKEHFYESAKLH